MRLFSAASMYISESDDACVTSILCVGIAIYKLISQTVAQSSQHKEAHSSASTTSLYRVGQKNYTRLSLQ